MLCSKHLDACGWDEELWPFQVVVTAFTSRGNRRVRSGSLSPGGKNTRHEKATMYQLDLLVALQLRTKWQNLNKKKAMPKKKKKKKPRPKFLDTEARDRVDRILH